MLIYEATKSGFTQDVVNNEIVKKVRAGASERGIGVSHNEVRSWENSLQHMYNVLSVSDVPGDAGVAIEYQIPVTSKRIDFMVTGHGLKQENNVVIVELKQWGGESTQRIPHKDGVVKTFVGGGIRETTHPSYQAWSYSKFIEDFNVHVQLADINIYPVAYLHNFDQAYRDELINEGYEPHVTRAPLYLKQDGEALSMYLAEQVKHGDGGALIRGIEDSDLKPSKKLQDSLTGMLEDREEFTLIDSQKVVFERAVELAMQSQRDGKKRVYIVDGGPGTGKTVVAVNILGELIQRDLTAQYVSKNRTPREVYKRKLKGDMMVKEIDHLFKGAGSYVESPSNQLPALIADEAHRLNEESTFFGRGENQIMEIINAARFSVFFIDESQRVHIDDIGSEEEILRHAEDMGAEVEFGTLEAQFRCSGSDGYIRWLDDVLEIRPTANAEGFDLEYDIRLFDSPQSLHEAIERKNEETDLSRVVAGYCWEWEKHGRADEDVLDIKIADYERSWNLDVSDPWAIAEGSIDEVGCIHTCQGLEFDYVGVIIGPDLKYRDGQIVTDHQERASTDRSLFGIKKMLRENPDVAEKKIDEIIKNTYRVLMSRGIKGCYVYCVDDELQRYLNERIANL